MDKVLVDDMRNLFLLNVSHSPECVLDQIQNIKKFVSDEEYIVIHISGSTKEQFLKESEENFKSTSKEFFPENFKRILKFSKES